MSTTNNIIQLYSDGKYVNKIYPKTTTDAVVDDKGNKLSYLLDNIDITGDYVSDDELNSALSQYATKEYVDGISGGSVIVDADGRVVIEKNDVEISRFDFNESDAVYVYEINSLAQDKLPTIIQANPADYIGPGHSKEQPSPTNKTVIDEEPLAIINTTTNQIYFKYRYRTSLYGAATIYFNQCHSTKTDYSLPTSGQKIFYTRSKGIKRSIVWNGSEFKEGTKTPVTINTFATQFYTTKGTYTIKYEFDLNGQTIKPAAGTVLNFAGGKLKNGILDCSNGVTIAAGHEQIFENVKLYHNDTQVIYDYWFDDIFATWSVVMNTHIYLSKDYTLDYKYMNMANYYTLSDYTKDFTRLTHIIGNNHTLTVKTEGCHENMGLMSAMHLQIEDLNVYCTNPVQKSLAYCFEGYHLVANNLNYIGYPRLYPNWNHNATNDTYFELKNCHIECQSFINEYNFRQILIDNCVIKYYNPVGAIIDDEEDVNETVDEDGKVVSHTSQYGNLFSCGPRIVDANDEADIKNCWVEIKNSFIGGGWEYIGVKISNALVTRSIKNRHGNTYTQYMGYDRMIFTNCEFDDFVLGTYNSKEKYVGNTKVEFNNCIFNCCRSRQAWNKIDTVKFNNCILKGYSRAVSFSSGTPFPFVGANDITFIGCTFTKEPHTVDTKSVSSTVSQADSSHSGFYIKETINDETDARTYIWTADASKKYQTVRLESGITYKISAYENTPVKYAFINTSSTIRDGVVPSWVGDNVGFMEIPAGGSEMVSVPIVDGGHALLYTIYVDNMDNTVTAESSQPSSISYSSGVYTYADPDFKWLTLETDYYDTDINFYGNHIIVNPNSPVFPISISGGTWDAEKINRTLNMCGNEFVYTKNASKQNKFNVVAYVNAKTNILPVNNTMIFSSSNAYNFFSMNTDYCASDFTISWRNTTNSSYHPGNYVTGYYNATAKRLAFYHENTFPFVNFKSSGQQGNVYGSTLLAKFKTIAQKGDTLWIDSDANGGQHIDTQIIYDGTKWVSPVTHNYMFKKSGDSTNRMYSNEVGSTYFDTSLGKPVYLKTPGTAPSVEIPITKDTYTKGNVVIKNIKINNTSIGTWISIALPAEGVLSTADDIAAYIADKFNNAVHGGVAYEKISVSSSENNLIITYNYVVAGDITCDVTDTTASNSTLSRIEIGTMVHNTGTSGEWVDCNGNVV